MHRFLRRGRYGRTSSGPQRKRDGQISGIRNQGWVRSAVCASAMGRRADVHLDEP